MRALNEYQNAALEYIQSCDAIDYATGVSTRMVTKNISNNIDLNTRGILRSLSDKGILKCENFRGRGVRWWTAESLPKSYRSGYEARLTGFKKMAVPAMLSMTGRHWWLAGWNDADMELCAPTT